MIKIRVTCGGCGISYKDQHGTRRYALKMPEDGPFMCDEAQAERLVRLGVAAYVTGRALEVPQDPDADNQEPEKITSCLDTARLREWDYNQLKKLADDMGVTPKGKKKADLIVAITAVETTPGKDTDPDESDGSEDDDLPELGAVDPE